MAAASFLSSSPPPKAACLVRAKGASASSVERVRPFAVLSSRQLSSCVAAGAAGTIQVLQARRGARGGQLARRGPRTSGAAVRCRLAAVAGEMRAAEEFPSFLPKEVEALEEKAARTMAARIQRLPVQTSLSPEPILTTCVAPKDAGSRPHPLLLLHSFDGSLLEWRRSYPLLEAGGAEPWALDTLGWGFSDTSREISSFSAEAKREHLFEFWKEYIGRPVVLVGPSLGGAAAIDFALAHPEAVAKLVLIDAQGFAEGVGNLSALPRLLAYLGVAVLRSVWLRSWAVRLAFKDPLLATSDAMRVGRLHCLMPGWADAMVSFMLSGGYNVAAHIPQIRQPTLVLWGEDDKILDKSLAAKFQEALPSLRLETLKDCGHIPHVEKPREVAELLVAFASDP